MVLKPIWAFLLALPILLLGCDDSTYSQTVTGTAGDAARHTAILRDTQGNPYGYYEYLPLNFDPQFKYTYPIIFYWNGQNTISGDGRKDLDNMLKQGLPQYINEGRHYPAIIISAMLPNWKKSKIKPFVDYILKRYGAHVDPSRIYMSGFSAGGGVTIRYISQHPEHIAAYLAIAPATIPPQKKQPSVQMAQVPSWFIHNSGDMTVGIYHSNVWNKALRDIGGEHKISRPDLETHYAWQDAYSSKETWSWLLSKRKIINPVVHEK